MSAITKIITNSWTIDFYIISSSYTPNHSIYLNIVSTKTFLNYNGYIYESNLNMVLDKFHTLMTNCFNQNQINKNSPNHQINKYSIEWDYKPSELNLLFFAKLDGFYDVEQKITLQEQNLSSDKTTTITLNIMKQQHKAEIQKINEDISELISSHKTEIKTLTDKIFCLETRICDLENPSVFLGVDPNDYSKQIFCDKNTDLIDFAYLSKQNILCDLSMSDFKSFEKMSQLKKISIFDVHIGKDSSTHYVNRIFNNKNFYFPNIEILTIWFSGQSINYSTLISLPNIKHLIFSMFNINAINENWLNLIKSFNKLEKITLDNCNNNSMSHMDNIKNYCLEKKINLEII